MKRKQMRPPSGDCWNCAHDVPPEDPRRRLGHLLCAHPDQYRSDDFWDSYPCHGWMPTVGGEAPTCRTCGRRKKPIGRDSMDNGLCDDDCPGYMQEPRPDHLWPGEAPTGTED